MKYSLKSVKGVRIVFVENRAEAIALAKKMQAELQPIYGVDVIDAKGECVATIE